MSLIKKIRDYFYEEDDDNQQVEQETEKIEEEVQPVVNNFIANETVNEIKTEKEVTPLPKQNETIVTETNKTQSAFVNIKESQPKVKPVEVNHDYENKYIRRGVISPIYGNSNTSEEFVYTNHNNYKENSDQEKSLIGTIFSPINGNTTINEEIPEDEVDDKIASMKTKDFINTVELETVVPEQVYFEPEYEEPPVEQQFDELFNQYQPIQEPVFQKTYTDIITSEQPVSVPEGSDDLANTDNYENLTLF